MDINLKLFRYYDWSVVYMFMLLHHKRAWSHLFIKANQFIDFKLIASSEDILMKFLDEVQDQNWLNYAILCN